MKFLDLMKSRYTTKLYDSTKKIAPELIDELKEVVRMSPSSINSQPWLFTFVENSEMKNKLGEVSYFNKEKINDCSVLVVLSRTDSVEEFEKWLNETQPEGAVIYYNNFIKPKSEEMIKAWFEKQLYLALGCLLTAAVSMDIDSTPMEGIEADKYDEILSLKGYKTQCAVALGYRSVDDHNQPSQNPKSRREFDEVVIHLK